MSTQEGVTFFCTNWIKGPNRRNGKFSVQKIPLNGHLLHQRLIAHVSGIVFAVVKTNLFVKRAVLILIM